MTKMLDHQNGRFMIRAAYTRYLGNIVHAFRASMYMRYDTQPSTSPKLKQCDFTCLTLQVYYDMSRDLLSLASVLVPSN